MKGRWRTGARRIKAVNSEATPPPVPPHWRVLGFWRGARRGKPPGSETRKQALEQRLGPFRRRNLPKNKRQQQKCRQHHAVRMGKKELGIRTALCIRICGGIPPTAGVPMTYVGPPRGASYL